LRLKTSARLWIILLQWEFEIGYETLVTLSLLNKRVWTRGWRYGQWIKRTKTTTKLKLNTLIANRRGRSPGIKFSKIIEIYPIKDAAKRGARVPDFYFWN
jgi:hypothetical protein